jgi:hypothetical protein
MFCRSFADIPLIIRDQFRGFVRKEVKMQAPLVFRPFASDSNILTWRDTRGILPSRIESWRDGSEVNARGSREGMSLSERLKGRGWTYSPPSKIPGLVNTGNFCFMNSVLQVRHLLGVTNDVGTSFFTRIPKIFRSY